MSNTKVLSFSGRIRRSDFFKAVLILGLIQGAVSLAFQGAGTGFLIFINLIFAVITLSYQVRRLHDIGMKGTIALIPFISLFLFIPSSYWGGFTFWLIQIYSAWFLYLALLDSEPCSNAYGESPKPLADDMIVSSQIKNRQMIWKVLAIVVAGLTIFSSVYDFITGRPMARPYEFRTALYVLEVTLPFWLIIIDRTRKQILTYISVIYYFALAIPLFLFWGWFYPWKDDNYNIFKHLPIQSFLISIARQFDTIIIFILFLYILKQIKEYKELSPVFFLLPSVISYVWGLFFEIYKNGLECFTEGIGIEGFNRGWQSFLFTGGFKFTFTIAMICIYNRMKLRHLKRISADTYPEAQSMNKFLCVFMHGFHKILGNIDFRGIIMNVKNTLVLPYRIRRRDFFIGMLMVGISYAMVLFTFPISGTASHTVIDLLFLFLGAVLTIGRLHDIGASGTIAFIPFLLLLVFVPYLFVGEFIVQLVTIYCIWLLYIMLLDSSHTANRYGSSPKPLPENLIVPKEIRNRKVISYILAVVSVLFCLIILFFNILACGMANRLPGTPAKYDSAIITGIFMIPGLLIVFDFTKKQIFTYIALILQIILPLSAFNEYDLIFEMLEKNSRILDIFENIFLYYLTHIPFVIASVLAIIILIRISKGKEVKLIMFVLSSVIPLIWNFISEFIRGNYSMGQIDFSYIVVWNLFYYYFVHFFAIAMVCIYNRMKIRLLQNQNK